MSTGEIGWEIVVYISNMEQLLGTFTTVTGWFEGEAKTTQSE